METTIEAERRQAHNLAEEYRSKGYEVIVEPSAGQLPDFLSEYQPDLLIRKGQEATVVEVKSRSSLAKNPRLRELARLLQTKPGWNFELVVVGEKNELDIPEGACPLTKEEILQRIKTATALFASGDLEAALLLAWPSVEAAVRMLTEEENIVLDHLTPSYIFKQAVINGVISREDYNLLTSFMKYRNALVHGFKPTDLDATLLKQLIDRVEHILQKEE
jgi:uncharacterized protein YutE (UPF0331/DUF86 family)